MADAPSVGLREFLERLLDERDRQYDARFRAADLAMQAAVSAQREAVALAFVANEKAIVKSEEAQRAYNERSNEFRGQLDDQAKMLMPRSEATALIRSMEEKFYAGRDASDRERNVLSDRIGALENNQANLQGRIWAVTAVAWLVALAVSIALRFIS